MFIKESYLSGLLVQWFSVHDVKAMATGRFNDSNIKPQASGRIHTGNDFNL